jgi:hypothetical protein
VANAHQLKIVVHDGFAKSQALLVQNAAPKLLHVTVKGGGKVVGEIDMKLEKKLGPQTADVFFKSGAAVDEVALRVDDVHKGTKYTDTCISDVVVLADVAVDDAANQKARTALNAWRQQRLAAAIQAKSDFAAATFTKRASATATGTGPACQGEGAHDVVEDLTMFIGGNDGDGVWVSAPDLLVPSGLGEVPVSAARFDLKAKAKKGAGRHKTNVDDLPDSDDVGYTMDTDVRLDAKAKRAFVASSCRQYGDCTNRRSGTVYLLDDHGRVTTAITSWSGTRTEYGGADGEPGAEREVDDSGARAVLFRWNAGGKIDQIIDVAPDCTKTTYQAAP